MTIQEKIIHFEGEKKRLTEKAQSYASAGQLDSARAILRLASGVKITINDLKKKV